MCNSPGSHHPQKKSELLVLGLPSQWFQWWHLDGSPGKAPKEPRNKKKTARKKDEKGYPQEDSLQNEAMFMLPCYVSKGPLQTHQCWFDNSKSISFKPHIVAVLDTNNRGQLDTAQGGVSCNASITVSWNPQILCNHIICICLHNLSTRVESEWAYANHQFW